MIKVIKHGNEHFLGKCPACNCEFEYTILDIETDEYGFSLGCPECGSTQFSSNIYGLRERFKYDDDKEEFDLW